MFVALGTYRDPFCPMTIKSLYDKASDPSKIFVGLFQQNCFGPVCRTGVLKGGGKDFNLKYLSTIVIQSVLSS